MSLGARDVEEIMKLLEASRFDRLSLELDGLKLELVREGASPRAATPAAPASVAAVPESPPPPTPAPKPPAARDGLVAIKSPLLGIFYRAPKPGEPPFVEVGAQVEEETIIGIIEVMKLMNSARAGVRGEVVEIVAANGELVEHGEALIYIRPPRCLKPIMPIRRILIANRGEIAVRIIRTCQQLGVETVLGVSEADRGSLGARMADRTLCLGPAPSAQSYLRIETVVQAALGSGCDAIHPGYGFLSERADLARLCEAEGVIFIGPTAAQIDAVGDKLRARSEAIAADVTVVPGGPIDTPQDAQRLAATIGAPLLVKAVGGGGGRGMKLVERLDDLDATIAMASAEAGAAFGDARVYLERYVGKGRHIEVQVLGDGEGRVIHLGERDCSVQRRYQKLIEETPAPHLPPATREAMLAAAVRFAARLHYRGAGTIEFLYDVERDQFYFLEMNARIQVEHPVTEQVTGVDLIAEQIAIASGEGLRLNQSDITLTGAAIECRINAEDPARGFAPSPGTVSTARWPEAPGIRVDTHIVDGARIPPYYDSMIAKVISHAPSRAQAIDQLIAALGQTRIEGIATNIAFQSGILADPEFAHGGVDTGYLARLLAAQEP